MKYCCTRAVAESTERVETFDSQAVDTGSTLSPLHVCLPDEHHQTSLEIRRKLLSCREERMLKDFPIHPTVPLVFGGRLQACTRRVAGLPSCCTQHSGH